MFNKMIEDLTEILKDKDITKLANDYQENTYIEFKDNRPLFLAGKKTDDHVATEFAADVSSFANTSGGLLIYGVKEKNSIPIEINPFVIDDMQKGIDTLKVKMSQILRTRIEPPIYGYKIEPIRFESENKFLIIMMIQKSINTPHAVIPPGREQCEFYGRRSEGGKYAYKYNELKNTFLLKDKVVETIRNFRDFRINKIINRETPLPLRSSSNLILHLISTSAFESNQDCDPEIFFNNRDLMALIGTDIKGTNSQRRNLDGILFYNDVKYDGKYTGYVQLYRRGILESIDAIALNNPDEKNLMIPNEIYEKRLVSALKRYLQAFKELEIQPPVLVFLTLTGVKEFQMSGNFDPVSEVNYEKYRFNRCSCSCSCS